MKARIGLFFGIGLLALAGLFLLNPSFAVWTLACLHEPEYEGLSFFSGSTILQCLGIWFVLYLLVRIAHGLMVLSWSRRRPLVAILGDQNGALVFEFALIFPFILALVFIFFQWCELLMADALTHYAAYAACRAASTYGPAPTSRFQLDDTKKDVMKRAATIALAGAMAVEADINAKSPKDHQKVVMKFIRGNGTESETASKKPENGGGAHRYVHVEIQWGFFPRWPLAQLFFKPLVVNGRLQDEADSCMQIEGYYRSYSYRSFDEGDDRYASENEMENTDKREGLIQKALYRDVIPYDHDGSTNPYQETGDRSTLASGCKESGS